jgi:hypothetical protein
MYLRRGEPLALDQGLFACFTRFSGLPYRDLFDSKPPLFLYSYKLARLFPGDITQKIWWLEAVWLIATMAVAYVVASRWGKWSGIAAAALLFLGEWAPGWGGFWARAQADEFLALPLLLAALFAFRESAFWAGFFTGVAGLFKIPSLSVAAAWPLVFGWRKCGWMILGLVLPWAIASLWFAAHGAFGDFVEAVFVYHRYNAEYISPPFGQVVVEWAKMLLVNAPLLLLSAAFARDKRLFAFAIFPLVAVLLQRQLAGYQFLLAMPALAIAGGVGLVELARKKWLVLLVVPLLGLAGWQWWQGYAVPQSYVRGSYSPEIEQAATRFIQNRTRSSEGILVWGMAPGIYALSDRHPVTRYPFHKILMTEAPLSRMIPGLEQRRTELLERMRRDPPALILVGRKDTNGFEPEDSYTTLRKWDQMYDLVSTHYEPVGEIGRFIVLGRR